MAGSESDGGSTLLVVFILFGQKLEKLNNPTYHQGKTIIIDL